MEQTVYTTIWKKLGIDERETYLLSEHNALLEAHPNWEEQLRILDAPTPPVPTLEQAKAAKRAEIAAARYAAEIAGVTVGGVTVRTDRESQALITGAALKAIQDATYTCRWKTESGFVTLDAATIIAVADAVRSHVQGCFDAEDAKCVLIDAAETVEDVEAVEW